MTRAKNYRNLHKLPYSPNWIFRKYSKEKRAEFVKSTGIPATEKDAAKAYKIGLDLFNEWLGVFLPSGRQLLMKDLFRAVLASKENLKHGKKGATYRSCRNQTQNHLIPAFGHLKADQMNSRRWEDYDSAERARGRTALANTRKYLIEAMNRAEEQGLVRRVPKFKKNDPQPAPPKYLEAKVIRSILRHKSCRFSKLLFFIMWKQGARPEEILQYRFEMLRWNEGEHGYIYIPGEITKTGRSREIPLNSRVARALRSLEKRAASEWVFPSRYKKDDRQTNYAKAWEGACGPVEDGGLNIDATPYNLRDTFITDCLRRGLSTTFIAKYVDTSAAMIERKYAVAVRKEMEGVAG